jgi:soluble lytic murein transglycosylase-like protein
MTAGEVHAITRPIAEEFSFDPVLVTAVCQQESSFDHQAMRLENGFFRRYVKGMPLASSSKVLLSASYGLMQVMGLTLKERGYFQWYVDWYNEQAGLSTLLNPDGQIPIVRGVDEFMSRPEWQVRWGVKTLDAKRKLAGGDVAKALLFYNGGGNPAYPDEVLEKCAKLRDALPP